MKRWLLLYALLIGLSSGAAVQAQTCNVTVNPLSSVNPYDPFAAGNNITQGSFTFSCTRLPGSNSNLFPATFWVGLSNGSQLTSILPPSTLNYGMFQDYPGCAAPWNSSNGFTFANSKTGNGDKDAGPFTANFCFRINAAQITARPSPNYRDITPLISVRFNNSAGFILGLGSFDVSTRINDACSLTTPPPNMNISYTAFSTAAATGASNFAVRCTNTTPYTMALDSLGGTLTGLMYSLSLSAPSSSGSGSPKSHSVTGTIPPGQAGTCTGAACAASRTHTLTVGY